MVAEEHGREGEARRRLDPEVVGGRHISPGQDEIRAREPYAIGAASSTEHRHESRKGRRFESRSDHGVYDSYLPY